MSQSHEPLELSVFFFSFLRAPLPPSVPWKLWHAWRGRRAPSLFFVQLFFEQLFFVQLFFVQL